MPRWVVVGAGAGGCVVAGRLSADSDNDVMLLEAGADHGPNADPGDRGPYLSDPARLDTIAVHRRPNGPLVPYPTGRGLGGSSLVNGTIVVPDGPGTGAAHLLPIEDVGPFGPIGSALLDADPRARPLSVVRRRGRRVTAADAYVRPHLDRPNLRVVTGTAVDRVVLAGTRAIGVTTSAGDDVDADRVVLCAGAIRTPELLLRSGVAVDGIGRHLQDQPAFAIVLGVDPSTIDRTAHDITVASTVDRYQVLAVNRLDGRDELGGLMVALTEVTSRGSVVVDREGRSTVQLGALDTVEDRERLTSAVLGALEVLRHPAMRAVVVDAAVDDVGTPASEIAGDRDAVRSWLPDHLTGYHHVAGTCRRGLVTDADGWVRGHTGLAVCDASLFVDAPPTNTYLATIALAEEVTARWRNVG